MIQNQVILALEEAYINKYANKNLYESLSAYGVGFHRHNSEIEQEINKITNKKFNVTFTPHLAPMFKGILSYNLH